MNDKQIVKRKPGRPTKYRDHFPQVVEEYLKTVGREQTELPTVEGLALELGVDDTTILKWGEDNPEFLATIKHLKHKQKNQLMNDGMYGGKEVNSTMAIFLLKVNHGMIETEKRILSGDQDAPIQINVNIALQKAYGPIEPVITAKVHTDS